MKKHRLTTKKELSLLLRTEKFRDEIISAIYSTTNGRVPSKYRFCNLSTLAELIKYCDQILSMDYFSAQAMTFDSSERDLIPDCIWSVIEFDI